MRLNWNFPGKRGGGGGVVGVSGEAKKKLFWGKNGYFLKMHKLFQVLWRLNQAVIHNIYLHRK